MLSEAGKIVYVDMDDTICHYTSHHQRMVEQNPSIQYPQSQFGFFLGLEPIDGAIEYVNKLCKTHQVYILTRPSILNPLCYTEKRVWVEKYFGLEFCKRLIICPDKGLLRGDYLIDDYPWPGFQGEQIHFGKPPFESWKKVYSHLVPDTYKDENIHGGSPYHYYPM